MELFGITILTSFLFCLAGGLFFADKTPLRSFLAEFPRSRKLAHLFISLSVFWFLYRHVSQLSEADFGEYKVLIGILSIGIAIGSCFFVSDFLAVRGLSILILFYSREALDLAFLQEPASRLYLVAIVYALVIGAIYFGAWPFKMRDFMKWVLSKRTRSRNLGLLLILNGVLMTITALSY